MSSSIPPIRNEIFFCETVTYKVDNVLFKVPRYNLERTSPVLLRVHEDAEAGTEGRPHILKGCKAIDFQRLLCVVVPELSTDRTTGEPVTLKTKEEWMSVLTLATNWEMKKIRHVSIGRISGMDLLPTEKILLARKHRVAEWFVEGVTALVTSPNMCGLSSKELGSAIGWEATATLWRLIATHNLHAPPPKIAKVKGKTRAPFASLYCVNDQCKDSPFMKATCDLRYEDVDAKEILGRTSPTATATDSPGRTRTWRECAAVARTTHKEVDIDCRSLHTALEDGPRYTLPPGAIEEAFAEELKTLSAAL